MKDSNLFARAKKMKYTFLICLICSLGLLAEATSNINQIVSKTLGGPKLEMCDDTTFIRRVTLDLAARLPTIREVKVFIEDKRKNKRQKLLNRLIGSPSFVDYTTMKWCERLRVKSEFPIKLWPNAVQAYARYLEQAVSSNMPYDQMVRELLTSSGSNFRVAPVNFYRALADRSPRGIAAGVALSFLGQRMEDWSDKEQEDFAKWFESVSIKKTREWKEEIVYFDPGKDFSDKTLVLPEGHEITIPWTEDPRLKMADWVTSKENVAFKRLAVQRIWYDLMGTGLLERVDDLQAEDLKSQHPVLIYLEKELVESGWDLRHVVRLVTESQIYQQKLSNSAKLPKWARYVPRRLEAEVLSDVLDQVLRWNESYSSKIPEPFTFVPSNQKTVRLDDGSISSRSLELFGRSPRDTGTLDEKNLDASFQQSLELINSSSVQAHLKRHFLVNKAKKKKDEWKTWAHEAYLHVLSRFPRSEELAFLESHFQNQDQSREEKAYDILWALINSREFIYRH